MIYYEEKKFDAIVLLRKEQEMYFSFVIKIYLSHHNYIFNKKMIQISIVESKRENINHYILFIQL